VGNILVADDDRTCRDSIRKVLEKEGHNVRVAEDVDGALSELSLGHFDLIVCDYRMPGKTGLDFLRELKQLGSHIPVLMISACADSTVLESVLELGAAGVLKKPIRRRELIDRAAMAVGG
jgi:CheY-like chemotaxis protein